MAVIVATAGAANANSYETYSEANTYFDERIPITPPWVASGNEAYLIYATRTLDALAQPFKVLIPAQNGEPAYYRVRRQWTGSPASSTQKLAWPRAGMYDMNGNPLDIGAAVSAAASAVIVTDSPHGKTSGDEVFLFQSNTTPTVNGARIVTVLSATSFSIPVTVTVGGSCRVTWIPSDLKAAESELAGSFLKGDRTLDNDVVVQGLTSLRAGSVSLGFKDNIVAQVIPDAVYNLMPLSWLTDELYEPALAAIFEVASSSSYRRSTT